MTQEAVIRALQNGPLTSYQLEDEQNYLKELAMELIAICEKEEPKSAWVKLEAENLDNEQKVALWTLLPSKVRSALKNAKG